MRNADYSTCLYLAHLQDQDLIPGTFRKLEGRQDIGSKPDKFTMPKEKSLARRNQRSAKKLAELVALSSSSTSHGEGIQAITVSKISLSSNTSHQEGGHQASTVPSIQMPLSSEVYSKLQ